MLDLFRLGLLPGEDLLERVTLERGDWSYLDERRASGRKVIVITGHIGAFHALSHVLVERGFPAAMVAALRARGHNVLEVKLGTSANSIAAISQGFVGAADPRTRGALAVGY